MNHQTISGDIILFVWKSFGGFLSFYGQLFCFILCSYAVNIARESINNALRGLYLTFLSKAQHPSKELVADVNIRRYGKMMLIKLPVSHAVLAKLFNYRVQQGINKTHLHKLRLASEH